MVLLPSYRFSIIFEYTLPYMLTLKCIVILIPLKQTNTFYITLISHCTEYNATVALVR